MSRSESTFVLELPLRAQIWQAHILEKRFEAARNLYNAVLAEGFKRLRAMRRDPGYEAAKKESDPRERRKRFSGLRREYGFTEYDLHRYVTELRKSWIGDHLGPHEAQKLATRAFQALERWSYGRGGKPRFKGKNRIKSLVLSVEGKTASAGLIWKEDHLYWRGLQLPALIDRRDPVVRYGLDRPVKYARIVRRMGKDGWRYFVQLILEGDPFRKPPAPGSEAIGGMDPGPKQVAWYDGEEAGMTSLVSPALKEHRRELRQLHRKADRQRRAANPENHLPDGRVKPGPKIWRKTKAFLRTEARIREIERKEKSERKRYLHELANRFIARTAFWKIEKPSVKAWQKAGYGKSIKRSGLGTFVGILTRKAERAGGWVLSFDPRKPKLSRTCICGRVEPKPLSQRVHRCPECGVVMHRDLFSAFLAVFVDRDHALHVGEAQKAWPDAGPRLLAAWRAAGRSDSI